MVKNTVAIIQARTNSIRLPNKIMFKINNMMLIEILYRRLKKSKKLNEIIIATTKDSKILINFLKKKKIKFFIGSEKNVLNRYYKAAVKFKAATIVIYNVWLTPTKLLHTVIVIFIFDIGRSPNFYLKIKKIELYESSMSDLSFQ